VTFYSFNVIANISLRKSLIKKKSTVSVLQCILKYLLVFYYRTNFGFKYLAILAIIGLLVRGICSFV